METGEGRKVHADVTTEDERNTGMMLVVYKGIHPQLLAKATVYPNGTLETEGDVRLLVQYMNDVRTSRVFSTKG